MLEEDGMLEVDARSDEDSIVFVVLEKLVDEEKVDDDEGVKKIEEITEAVSVVETAVVLEGPGGPGAPFLPGPLTGVFGGPDNAFPAAGPAS